MSASVITTKSNKEATLPELLIALGDVKGINIIISGKSIDISAEDWEAIIDLAWKGFNSRET